MKPPPAGSSAQDLTRARLRRRGLALLALGMATAVAANLVARTPWLVEAAYASWFGPAVARRLSLLTGWIPFSVAAAGALVLSGIAGRGSYRMARRIRRGQPARPLIFDAAARCATVGGVLILAFYLTWGLNYARAPLDARLGIAADRPIDLSELRALTETAAARTNEAYMSLHGSVDAGEPTAGRVAAVETSRALEVGWLRVSDALDLGREATRPYGPVKTRGATWLIDALDIMGIYVPFTGEAHASGAQPDVSFPAVAAHEQAHQRGIARENEATFAGVLAAIHADDPLSVYSGWARVLRSLQTDLSRADRAAWSEVRETLLPGVVRDWQDYYAWLSESRSPAAPIVEATNHAYLRAHGVPGGIESYGRVTELLLEWARRNGGGLTLAPNG